METGGEASPLRNFYAKEGQDRWDWSGVGQKLGPKASTTEKLNPLLRNRS